MSFFDITVNRPDYVMAWADTGKYLLERAEENLWKKDEITVKLENGRWILTSPAEGVKKVLLRWKTDFEKNVRILNDHYERGYGDLEWKGYVDERVLPWYFMLAEDGLTYGYGVKTNPNALCYWQVSRSDISLYMDVRSLGCGVQLGDKELCMAEAVQFEGCPEKDAFESTQELCRRMCSNGIFPEKPVYGGNNWYYAYGISSEEEILSDADRIAGWSQGLTNRPFMVVDACWQEHVEKDFTCAGGPYIHGNERFPDMAALAKKIKEKDVRPGIWFRPLLTKGDVPESWILHPAFENEKYGNILDPTVPEVLQMIGEDVRRMVSWGYELLKYDFSTFDVLGRWGKDMGLSVTSEVQGFYDNSVTTAQALKMLYKTIYDNAGNAVIIGCNTMGHLITGYAHLQRTGDDTSGIDWEWTRIMGINTLSHRMPQHGIFFAADADCVGITTMVPWKMNSKWLDILSRSSTPLFISAAPDAMTPEIEKDIRDAFRRASEVQDMMVPQDWLSNTCPTKWKSGEDTYFYDWSWDERFPEESVRI